MSKVKKRSASEISSSSSKPKPKSQKKRKTLEQDENLDSELGINTAFSSMDNILISDLFAQKIAKFGGELSSVEVADISISGMFSQLLEYFSLFFYVSILTKCAGNFVRDTTSWSQDRLKENLPQFLDKFAEDQGLLGKASKNRGELHTLIVTGAGLRAADIVR